MLTLLVDSCVPGEAIAALGAVGYDVASVRDRLPGDASDLTVLRCARDLDAVLVSLDNDFTNLAAYPPANYGGIIALQVRNFPEYLPQLLETLLSYLQSQPDPEHYRGALLYVEVPRIYRRE
ncbi:hypothetical protein KR51_00035290 [Rubidibacter lacunae KORDI 51-2]|uniref:DUF5615 domain-containing protein n=1 Tax=Rubidibacter lacunae KORDI 51-2 TaxID=582515 RepID=U5DE81_9CHRO|nr:DUF5615 family PIN-like protein [Rubidibacter lacunae]ERN39931.1 hypothetical protein KR51_00035290 [Rubidibacter lacunae KORDI 51-2]